MFDVAVTIEVGQTCHDIVLQIDPTMRGSELIGVIASRVARRPAEIQITLSRSGSVIDPDEALETYAIQAGDMLVITPSRGTRVLPGGDAEASAPASPTGLALHVVSGPHTDMWAPLDLGDNAVGRQGEGLMLSLPSDEAASRVHASFAVRLDGSVMVADAGSTNGTYRNGSLIGDPVPVAIGDRIQVGDSEIVLALTDRTSAATGSADRTHVTYGEGTLGFNRQPRVINPDPGREFRIDAPPDRPPKRKLPLSSALVPVVMGAAMFAVTKSAMYLMFTAMGPVMAIWSFVDDKRSGRKDFAKTAKGYREKVIALDKEVDEAMARSATWRRTEHPDLETIERWASSTSPQLWNRRPSDPDMLDLRVGVADQPSLVLVTLEPGGDADLRVRAEALVARSRLDLQVPVVAPLRELGVFGVVGRGPAVDELVRGLVIQLAALHSPRDLALVAMAPTATGLSDWAKWLPHVRALSDDGSTTIAADESSVQALFESVKKLADARKEATQEAIGGAVRFAPHIVLLIQPPVRIPPKEMAELLSIAPSVGISVLWVAADRPELPNECRGIVEFDPRRGTASLTFTATGERVDAVTTEGLSVDSALEVARGLAPLRDITLGSSAEGIPDSITLPNLLELVPPTASVLLERWAADPGDLSATIGVGPFGPVSVDLRKDGPHGLVAGTTGAGKSEFLQSLVASLAIAHAPSKLTFVFVDYKGGAAFQECVLLPHSLGIVTDLDAHLTRRALTSLNAELRRREHLILAAGAIDLIDMAQKAPDAAPPSMLIIIDEFAALAREVPEFVDGVVDIAQRGRSLGIHLLLATQTPKGVINDKIQANTNLRVALRTADADESRNILERPDAALISRATPGRGYLKTGPTEVVEFQSAYVGAATNKQDDTPKVATARTFALSLADRQAAADAAKAHRAAETDLGRVVVAAREAMQITGTAEPHKPWLPPLGDLFSLDALLASYPPVDGGLALPLGVADDPSQQAQFSWALDLDDLGSVFVYGGPTSGKTTLLRSIALSASQRFTPEQVYLYGFDFGSRGLLPLNALPHCGGIVAGDDIDRVRRLVAMLDGLAQTRRALLGDVGAGSAAEYRNATDLPMAEVIVLLDNFSAFWATMDPIDKSQHNEALMRLVSDSKGVGLHFVISADRRSAIPPAMSSTVAGRLVLRMANPEEYSGLGLRELEKAPPLVTGRAFTETGLEVQLAVATTAAGADGVQQATRIGEIATHLNSYFPDSAVPQVRLLPEELPVSELPPPEPGVHRPPIGWDEVAMAPVYIDLDDDPLFLVAGPNVSGRTNLLSVMTQALLASDPQLTPWLLTTRRSALVDLPNWAYQAIGLEQAGPLAEQLAALVEDRAKDGWITPILVVLDDADEFADGPIADRLDVVQRRARDAGVILLAAVTSFKAKRMYSAWPSALRNNRHGIVLQPDLETDGDIFGPRLPQRASLVLPPGRGFLMRRNTMTLVHTALAPT